MNVNKLLAERQSTHGDFANNAFLSQSIKAVFASAGRADLTPVMQESLDLTATKLARILAGEPTFVEHWRDIVGYIELVILDLEGRKITTE